MITQLFTTLIWPGEGEMTAYGLRITTCPQIYHTWWQLSTVPYNAEAERQAGKLRIAIFVVFGLTWLRIELAFTVSVANVPFTQPRVGNYWFYLFFTKIKKTPINIKQNLTKKPGQLYSKS